MLKWGIWYNGYKIVFSLIYDKFKKKLRYKIDKVEQLNNGIIVWH